MRWLHDIRKYPVGTNGGSGFKFPHWKSIGLTPRGSSVKCVVEGLVRSRQNWPVSQPNGHFALACCCTSILLNKAQLPRQVSGTSGPAWGKRQQPCTPEKAQCPEDLNRNSKRGFTNLQWVSNRSLQCSTSDCYCLKWPSTLAQLRLDSNCWWFGLLPFFMYLTETS